LVHDDDRNLRRYFVEVLASRVPHFGQLGIVVPETDDHVRPVDEIRILLGPGGQRGLEAGDIGHLPIGRSEQVCRERLQSAHHDVAVAVDESRQHGAAGQVKDFGRVASMGHNAVHIPEGQDATVTDGYRFDNRLIIVNRQYRAAAVYCIRDFLSAGAAAEKCQCKEQAEAPPQFRHVPYPRY
jgi:hypothetical protein